MRKKIIPLGRASRLEPSWLKLETSVEAEVTSEDPAFPLESALGIFPGPGWKAADAGSQAIRLYFDHALSLRRIFVEFHEEQRERSQEFVLLASGDRGQTWREIVRQHFNFSSAATREVEDFNVELNDVTALELQIIPDLAHRQAHATLRRLQIA